MKANTIIAVAVSVSVFLVVSMQTAVFLAGSMTPNKVPVISASAGVLDEFLVTPLVFLVTGLILGVIIAAHETLRTTVIAAAITGAAISVSLTIGLHSLLNYLQTVMYRMGQDVNIGASSYTMNGLTIAAALLWVAWYVMGAVLGYRIRNWKKAK